MTTASQAYTVVRNRLTSYKPAGLTALRWQGEDGGALPDTPAAFCYTEFVAEPASLVSFGGGRGQNRYRNPARVDFFVFVPRGQGLIVATDLAEQVATLFRSYRDSDISCFEATVHPLGDGAQLKPPGLRTSEVANYYCAAVEVAMFFDLIG